MSVFVGNLSLSLFRVLYCALVFSLKIIICGVFVLNYIHCGGESPNHLALFFSTFVDFILNVQNKSMVCILHEYAQHALKEALVFTCENSGHCK